MRYKIKGCGLGSRITLTIPSSESRGGGLRQSKINSEILFRMKDSGEIIAFDKSLKKINQILMNAEKHGFSNIKAFVQNGIQVRDKWRKKI